jgi:DNA-binding XRE family transcriptional regulator
MPNLAIILKMEIVRLARKEVRSETEGLRKTLTALRKELSAARKQLREIETRLAREQRGQRGRPERESGGAGDSVESSTLVRFSAKGLASNRKRLGLSTEAFGRLVGATGQAVYAWERGTSKPRDKYLPAIAALRGMGKKEVAKRLEELSASE